ncbi:MULTISPECIES: hypothetical protein [unclassified Flavobacterium]|mgnify:CR=1 FL=1|uniref:hypothetical protein n=1 Tax=unclassified Flavobacterium TaxID=196869 RepID=UPI00086BD807|nr:MULTISPECIES: hypothetical protein [unclassified Flavobacterium]MBN9285641.1 hypothetical protein [Flavobacterium sp.]ODS91933.1 MAG: hypothetical protein ABS44_00100 [Chryseobacterium sp. SCN 40-13]OJV71003.1 MAG: hypothetical protein BGO42_04105 [Flavobacterium sp. 40-81]
MAKNPKIEFYRINLSPLGENENITFKDVLIKKELLERQETNANNEPIPDNQIMPYLLSAFIRDIDGVAIRNESKKKAFYAENTGENRVNRTISPIFERCIIHGRIKGGNFDTGKFLDEIDTPGNNTESLGVTKLLSDDFYFLLYTPLNKKRGILILQTYTQDSIADIFRPFVENVFKVKEITNKATSSLFMPEEMQNQFKEQSIIKKFEYKNQYIVPAIQEEGLAESEFTINVTIASHGNQINLTNLPAWKRVLGRALFNFPNVDEREIETFNRKRGYIKGGFDKSNPTKFSLDEDNFEIKATIYLDNFIQLEENGTPNWEELHAFALRILTDDVIPEIYPEDDLI